MAAAAATSGVSFEPTSFNYKDGLPTEVRDLFEQLDAEGKGYLSQQELKNLVNTRLRMSVARSEVEVRSRSEVASSVVVKDLGLSGKRVTEADMARVHSTVQDLKEEKQNYRRLIGGMVIALIVLSMATFAVCFAAVELAKETHVRGDNTITVGSGATALIGSADTQVVNGMLVSRKEEVCQNGTGTCSHALATRPAAVPRQLSSRISNEVFKSLDTITFSMAGDSRTTMAFRIHGFVRARSSRSQHGTVVHLSLLQGTLTLDDTSIYLDRSLSSYLESLGLLVADQKMSAHGRRLQDSQVVVTGLFSLFDEVDFEDIPAGEEPPRSPELPYSVTWLERRPCKTVEACQSELFAGEFLPGYDAASNSVAVRMELVETETWSMTIARMPNHPTQQTLTFTDHLTKTTRVIQFTKEDFPTHCRSTNYTNQTFFNASEWYITYIGEVSREETVYTFLDEVYTVPAATNRFFHLISKGVQEEATDSEAIIHFEDDSASMFVKRIFIPNAAEEDWTVQEVIVLDMQEINDTAAEERLSKYDALFDCGRNASSQHPWEENNTWEGDDLELEDGVELVDDNGTARSDFPVVNDAAHDEETMLQVLFYVQDLIDVDALGPDPYWLRATSELNALLAAAEAEEAALYEGGTNATVELNLTSISTSDDGGRLLGSGRNVAIVPSFSKSDCLTLPPLKPGDRARKFCMGKSWPRKRSDCPGCTCESFGVEVGSAVDDPEDDSKGGWTVSGSVGIGTFCKTAGKFSAVGSVGLFYAFPPVKYKKKGVGIKCEFEAGATVTAGYSKFGYTCRSSECNGQRAKDFDSFLRWCRANRYDVYLWRRRLGEDEEVPGMDDDSWDPTQPEESELDMEQNASTDADVEDDADEDEEEEGEDVEEGALATARRLGGRRRRRRRWGYREDPHRRRRTKWCSIPKFFSDWNDSRRRINYKDGADLSLTFSANGGCEAGNIGVGITGSFQFYFGPFPKNPLQPRSQGKVSVGFCIKIVFSKICVTIFKATLWSKTL